MEFAISDRGIGGGCPMQRKDDGEATLEKKEETWKIDYVVINLLFM